MAKPTLITTCAAHSERVYITADNGVPRMTAIRNIGTLARLNLLPDNDLDIHPLMQRMVNGHA